MRKRRENKKVDGREWSKERQGGEKDIIMERKNRRKGRRGSDGKKAEGRK